MSIEFEKRFEDHAEQDRRDFDRQATLLERTIDMQEKQIQLIHERVNKMEEEFEIRISAIDIEIGKMQIKMLIGGSIFTFFATITSSLIIYNITK